MKQIKHKKTQESIFQIDLCKSYEKNLTDIIYRIRNRDFSDPAGDLITLAAICLNGTNEEAEQARINTIKHFVNDNKMLRLKTI